jgi:flagellar hook protein FlgE
MFLNPAMSAALDRIADRAADVRLAFTPGAQPRNDDVAITGSASNFTLDPLSAAAPEGAYFMTSDAQERTGYSRDGSFRISNGTLVDSAGRAVLGRRAPGGPLVALSIDPVDAALGRAQNARLEADGSFVYSRPSVDPRTGERSVRDLVVGRIALARFPAGSRLDVVAGGGRFTAPIGVAPHVGVAGDGSFGALVPMRRERSRVDLDESLARLKDAYVAFDALAAAETAKDHFGKAAMDVVK